MSQNWKLIKEERNEMKEKKCEKISDILEKRRYIECNSVSRGRQIKKAIKTEEKYNI